MKKHEKEKAEEIMMREEKKGTEKGTAAKRWKIAGIACAAVLLCGATACTLYFQQKQGTEDVDSRDAGDGTETESGGDEIVMIVNGLEITGEEYQFFEDQEAGIVSSYFSTEYGADTGNEDFWDTEYGGETPGERLRELTEENIIYSKTVQCIAKAYELDFPENFTQLEKEREEENVRREEAVSAGKTVYGPTEYGMYEYYSYRFGELEEALKEKLRENVFTFSEEELKAAYDSIGEAYFDRGYRGEARVYVAAAQDGSGQSGTGTDAAAADAGYAALEEIREFLLAGAEADVETISGKYGTTVNMYEYSFEGESAFKDNDQMQQVMEIYAQLSAGDISGVQNVMGYDCIVQCISKEDLGISTWEENREFLIRHCLEEKYADYIEKQCAAAEIQWIDKN